MKEGWQISALGEVCDVIGGGTPSKRNSAFYEGDIPWATVRDMRNEVLSKTEFHISQEALNNSSTKVIPGYNVVIATRVGLGKVCLLEEDTAINQDLRGIIPKSENIDVRFLFRWFQSIASKIEEEGTGATVKGVKLPFIKSLQLPIPPLPEQKRIVAILDEAFAGIDTAIANTKKNLANARELFESYLNLVFDKARSDWIECQLSKICSIKHGFAFKSQYFGPNGQYIVLTPGSFFELGGFRDQGAKTKYYTGEVPEEYILEEGDFLFAMTEQAAGLLGSSLVVPKPDTYLHNQRLGLVQVRDGFDWHNDFFFHQFNTAKFRAAIQSSASGVKVRHTSPGKLGEIPIKYPRSVFDQQCVADKLNELQTESSRLQNIYRQKLTALAELKQSLLQKAFSGELTADNVIPITSAKKPSDSLTTDSPAFAAHIMAVGYHWHESQRKNKTFGHVKAQKTLHLVEAVSQIDLGRVPIKDAAGPNDFAHMRAAEKWAKDNEFYEFVQRPEGQRGYDFVKGKRYSEWLPRALDAVEPYKSALDRVVSLLLPLDTKKAELLATVYAAWNNLLLDGHTPADADIVHEARDNWHRDKQQYTKPQFHEAIDCLRSHGMVPTGIGKRVAGQENLDL